MPEGLKLKSGETIPADVVVTATGLNMRLLGGIELDGRRRAGSRAAEHVIYKGMMLSGVPNLFVAFGYANASWTLRSDLTARAGLPAAQPSWIALAPESRTPIVRGGIGRTAACSVSPSGYVSRAAAILPSQGDRAPVACPAALSCRDLAAMTFRRIDEALQFGT